MSISLKDINRPAIVLVVVANVALYYAILFGFDVLRFSSLIKNYESYVPGALLALIVGVLNAQLNHTIKARLVFWRWEHPLPGSRAFTDIMKTDDRINPIALKVIENPLPTEPTEQNRLWFKWYREFQNEPGISQVHREYLFTRDWAGLAVLLGVVLIPLAFWQMELKQALILLTLMIIQYLSVRWSARNHGYRFVASVLAYKSAVQ